MFDFLHRVLILCRKELLAILKDPSSRVILVAPIIMQSLLFGYAATFDLSHIPYVLSDRSRDAASAELIAKLDGTGVFQRVATPDRQRDIAAMIDTQRALLAVKIGPRFEQQLTAGEPVSIQLLIDARNSNTAGSAATYVNAVIDRYNAERRAKQGLAGTPLTVETRAWFNPNLETRWNMMPGMIAALSMVQTLLLTALSVAREREQGTFDQLLVTPLSLPVIMIGKAIAPILVGLAQSTLVLLITLFWFKVPLAGSLATLYLGLLLFTTASVGIGLSVSALSANMQQAMLYTFVLIMPMMLLSGLATPVRNMPDILQIVTYANPLRFAIDLVQRVYLEGVGLATVAPDFAPLLAITAITLPLAGWLFRNRLV